MNDTINNKEDLTSVIDEYGEIAAEVAKLNDKLKIKKAQLEEYSKREGVKKFSTSKYTFTYANKGRSLIVMSPSVTEADVVAAMHKDKDAKAFVHETYDSAGLKEFAESLGNTDEWLESLSLKLSKERTQIEVKPKKK